MLSSVNNLIVKEGCECILYNTMQILRHIQDYSEVKIKENIKTHLIIIKYLSLIAFLSFILWANFKPLIFSFKRFPSINAHAIANIVHALNTNIFKNILKSSKKLNLTILPHFMLLCIFMNSTDKEILKTINEKQIDFVNVNIPVSVMNILDIRVIHFNIKTFSNNKHHFNDFADDDHTIYLRPKCDIYISNLSYDNFLKVKIHSYCIYNSLNVINDKCICNFKLKCVILIKIIGNYRNHNFYISDKYESVNLRISAIDQYHVIKSISNCLAKINNKSILSISSEKCTNSGLYVCQQTLSYTVSVIICVPNISYIIILEIFKKR